MFNYKEAGSDILVTGDIHINSKKYSEFERNRVIAYANILREHVGVIILAGDIFDLPKPTFVDIALFYEFIEIISTNSHIYVISGNHEVFNKEQTVYDFLPATSFSYIKSSVLNFGKTSLFLIGHPYIEAVLNTLPLNNTNILVSHYRSRIAFADEELDNKAVSERFDFTVLSDIHKKMVVSDNIQYTASPYSINFENIVDTVGQFGYTIISLKGEGEFDILQKTTDLPCKYRVDLDFDEIDYWVKQFSRMPQHLFKVVLSYYPVSEETTRKLTNLPNVIAVISNPPDVKTDSVEEIVDSLKDGQVNNLIDIIDDNVTVNLDNSVPSCKDELRGLLS
jgi:DNA repair exonuclease SbcCD nuclease subunit